MERNVSHVQQEKFLIIRAVVVNVPILSNGMDLLAQGYLIVEMDKNGMYTLIVVNVLTTCIGQDQSVKIFPCVKEEEFWMPDTDVYALKESSGMEKGVHFLTVWEGKFGMEQNVYVQQEETSMELFVCSASMGKNGITKKKFVNALQDINGQELLARKLMNVVETEFGTLFSNTVSVLKDNTGTEDNATFSQNAQEVKSGISKLSNVFAQEDQNGIQESVRFVETDKYGMNLH